ncbi:MAG: hypothetical protein V3W41_14195 [Planctomycetota bacterium]
MSDSKPRQKLWFSAILAFLALAFLFGTLWSERNDPFDRSMGAGISARYSGMVCRGYETFGLKERLGAPLLFFQPGRPESAWPYLNHPTLPYLYTFTFYHRDPSVRGLNYSSAVLLVLAIGGLLVLGRLTKGRSATFYSLAIFALMPAVLQHGRMIDAIVHAMAFLPWGFVAWWRVRQSSGGTGWKAFFFTSLLGGLIDWFCYLLVIVFWLDILLRRQRFQRPWRTAFYAGLPYGIALISYLLWLFWLSAAEEPMGTRLSWLMSVVTSDDGGGHGTSLSGWLTVMNQWFQQGAGPWIIGLAGLGAGLALSPWRNDFAYAAFLLFAAGLFSSCLFYARAMTHDFWIIPALPGLAMLAAVPLRMATEAAHRHRSGWTQGLLWLAIAALLFTQAQRAKTFHARFADDDSQAVASWIDERLGNDAILITNIDSHSVRYYAQTPILPLFHGHDGFLEAVNYLLPGLEKDAQIWLGSPRMDPKQMHLAQTLPVIPGTIEFRSTVHGAFLICRMDKKKLLKQVEEWRARQ